MLEAVNAKITSVAGSYSCPLSESITLASPGSEKLGARKRTSDGETNAAGTRRSTPCNRKHTVSSLVCTKPEPSMRTGVAPPTGPELGRSRLAEHAPQYWKEHAPPLLAALPLVAQGRHSVFSSLEDSERLIR